MSDISHSSGLSISRSGTQFTRLRNSIPDEKQFFQETLYQCSYRRANAYIGRPDLLTWKGIYHIRSFPSNSCSWIRFKFLSLPSNQTTDRDVPLRRFVCSTGKGRSILRSFRVSPFTHRTPMWSQTHRKLKTNMGSRTEKESHQTGEWGEKAVWHRSEVSVTCSTSHRRKWRERSDEVFSRLASQCIVTKHVRDVIRTGQQKGCPYTPTGGRPCRGSLSAALPCSFIPEEVC